MICRIPQTLVLPVLLYLLQLVTACLVPLVNEKEAGVFLAKGCKVPPNSVMRVGAQLSESMAGEYIVKATTKGELLMFGNFPFSILWTPLFCNLYLLYSDSLYVQTHLFCIGQNFPLLYFYIEDVFAKSEFDLGKFNTIQHGIDTGTNRPVKQRIRRTPLGFAGEEEAQLKKMFPFSILWTPLFCNLYLLYSDSLYVRTHLFCIGQNFPLLYFYIVIRYVNPSQGV
jgi:hypothetical protein